MLKAGLRVKSLLRHIDRESTNFAVNSPPWPFKVATESADNAIVMIKVLHWLFVPSS